MKKQKTAFPIQSMKQETFFAATFHVIFSQQIVGTQTTTYRFFGLCSVWIRIVSVSFEFGFYWRSFVGPFGSTIGCVVTRQLVTSRDVVLVAIRQEQDLIA